MPKREMISGGHYEKAGSFAGFVPGKTENQHLSTITRRCAYIMATSRKTPAKSPAKKKGRQRTLRTPAHGGGQLMTGGTNKGGPGRPPNKYKAFLQKIVYGEKHQKAVQKAMENDKHPAFVSLTKSAQLFVIGLPGPQDPAESTEVSGVILDLG